MAGVYISFPFCAQKCTYCNFASGVFPRDLEQRYIAALTAEICSWNWMWSPETVYIGGGSPSRLDPGKLGSLLAHIPAQPWIEATIEAAPGEIGMKKAAGWRQAGINRVSLGVQSFVANELSRAGRRHTAETVEEDIRCLRSAGIANINVDLIAGLPAQTMESFERSLDYIERLEPPHVSVYMLEVDQDSRLGRELIGQGSRYGAELVPSEQEIVAMYETAVERLGAMGLARYEISNFARPGAESRHNLKYWLLEPYIGFGAGAHSFDGITRARNAETAAEYVARWERCEPASVEQSPAIPADERFFVGLRVMDGVTLNPDDYTRFAEPIERFLAAGLLERSGSILKLTPRGVIYSNEVLQEFVTT
jgi:oxygen-independent coproporphyrinogen-3 oxidase